MAYDTPQGFMTDFDFFHGDWRVAHRRLKRRLAACDEWEEFGGTCATRPLIGGQGNIDDNIIELPSGAYRAATLRVFDPTTKHWRIWWLDARYPQALDNPMLGGFADGRGLFYADDMFEGRPIRVRFLWTPGASPQWEQAFSEDGGASWETNWVMRFTRTSEGA